MDVREALELIDWHVDIVVGLNVITKLHDDSTISLETYKSDDPCPIRFKPDEWYMGQEVSIFIKDEPLDKGAEQ